jgi:hypothetical protein
MFDSYHYSSGRTAPMDISPSKLSTRSQSATCAFPSWPRRSSLSESSHEERPTSYLSDEDLFPSDPFEDDAHSVSSAGSNSPSPFQSPPQQISEAELLRMRRERDAHQREVVRFLVGEKERRRQAAKKSRRSGSTSTSSGSGSAKKSPKSKLNAMTPIAEV